METALIALVGVLIGATLNQWLLHQFQQRRFLRERLTDRYAEFVGFAAKEWNRARAVRGIYLCRESPEDESGSEELSKLYTEESTLTYDLMRTSLQVQLLERDEKLVAMVRALENTISGIIDYDSENPSHFDEDRERLNADIEKYHRNLDAMVREIRKKYGLLRALLIDRDAHQE